MEVCTVWKTGRLPCIKHSFGQDLKLVFKPTKIRPDAVNCDPETGRLLPPHPPLLWPRAQAEACSKVDGISGWFFKVNEKEALALTKVCISNSSASFCLNYSSISGVAENIVTFKNRLTKLCTILQFWITAAKNEVKIILAEMTCRVRGSSLCQKGLKTLNRQHWEKVLLSSDKCLKITSVLPANTNLHESWVTTSYKNKL